ncbi:uncharacterized protein Z519_02310 [Cladophialophora bantiana CBS 173.52]|uniref:ABM domain-containing protein n=1 Tax=Cladophialophora bantiana (strain ATCC 10958 / CBS 173.52 / CDC B-1940 / NIH 8579) TaxID=1442370 RepID=A0A0D2IJI4_CLAB1|nr:uncharacterized protein Z519_02310 [Cladophialophora bantiana CBS 173.52]KIW96919.1 hypothetical protein Z519_02310 [Cladophialophora bantiana CBS 173.52]
MATEDKPLALVALVHPKTAENRDKALQLNASVTPFFRRPSTQCTTRSIFTPATRPKANLGMVPAAEKDSMFGVVEIWSSPAALATLKTTAPPEYKQYHSTVAREGLYSVERDMDISEWTPCAGFVARKGEKETPKAGIVMLAKFVCKDGEGMKDGLVSVIGKFCDWVEANEFGTLTYSVMASTTSPNEVLLFERYKDLAALGVHGKTAEFRAMFKGTGRFIQVKKTVLSEWEELEGSFVSNQPGGAGVGGQAKL